MSNLTTPRARARLALAAVTAVAAAGVTFGALAPASAATARPAVHASLTPNVTIQVKNADVGGCLKDIGLPPLQYEVASCAIASNFTRIDCGNRVGRYFCELEDGNGRCVTESGAVYQAGVCVGATTQLISDPTPLQGDCAACLFTVYDTGPVGNRVMEDFFQGAGQGPGIVFSQSPPEIDGYFDWLFA